MRLSAPVFILVAALASPTEIRAAQLETSERAQARRLLLEASRLIDEVPESQRSSAVANIASQLSRSGDLEDALRVGRSQKNPGRPGLGDRTHCLELSSARQRGTSSELSREHFQRAEQRRPIRAVGGTPGGQRRPAWGTPDRTNETKAASSRVNSRANCATKGAKQEQGCRWSS